MEENVEASRVLHKVTALQGELSCYIHFIEMTTPRIVVGWCEETSQLAISSCTYPATPGYVYRFRQSVLGDYVAEEAVSFNITKGIMEA